MLHLKKLELFGFKSFSDRQELRFTGDGIAAIVGPNGCGKSNISDAISWVLGEQSAKTLRGARMQDFIFNGSRDRKPSGLAQVSMTLLDPDGRVLSNGSNGSASPNGSHTSKSLNGSKGLNGYVQATPGQPAEVVVTRKLFRSGESQYLLNGKHCRLRDIQDLFMGTGLGPEHYAIIEQGRIDQILSSRPLDRRTFIEEAAGVTKFKNRRRLSELKLESARENLNRVNDILQEVTRQVNSLKRQASKARRYEELRGELNERLSLLLTTRYRSMDSRLQAAQKEMDVAAEEVGRGSQGLEQIEAGLAGLREKQQQKNHTLQTRREELSELALQLERLRSRIDQQVRMAEDNQARKQQAEAEIVHLDERLEQLQKELASGEAVVAEAARKEQQVGELLREKAAQVQAAQQTVREKEEIREQQRTTVLRLLGEVSELRNQLAKIEEFAAGNERQTTRLKEEEADAQQELGKIAGDRGEVQQQLQLEQQKVHTLAEQKGGVENELIAQKQELQTRRREVEQFQEEHSRLKARRESLDEILSHHAYTTESVKNLFGAVQRQPAAPLQPVGILADFLEVDSQHEKATEDFLREELEYVVVKTWDEAYEGIGLLQREVQGHATFLVHPESPVPAEVPALGPETGVVGRLADAIRLTNGLSGSASTLLPRLRGCYLVEEDELARRLAVQYPDLHFLMPDGRCYRGYTLSGGKKGKAGPLALKRELRELGPRISRIEGQLAAASQAVARAEKEVARGTEEIESLSQQLQRTEKAALALDHEVKRLDEQAQRAERRVSVVSAELDRVLEDGRRAADEKEKHEAKIEHLESQRMATEESLAESSEQIQQRQSEAARLAEEQVQLRTDLASLGERHKAAVESLDLVRQRIEEQQERKRLIAARIEQWETASRQLLENNVELEKQAAEDAERRGHAEQEAEAIAAEIEQGRGRIAEMEEQVKSSRAHLEEARERRSGIELRLVELRSDIKHLEETCVRELERPIRELLAGQPAEVSDEQLEEAEQDYQQLKTKLDSLGPVNVLALEEFKEAKQRLDFLETQQNDLLASIDDTQKVIAEIEKVSRRKFQEAFEAINNNFRQVFQTLFGGGIAEMRLTDVENAPESGVDIIASPPGKRLQNIALLSGGEKSLTAVALLMATFRYKPSPFCVLDEVDAALDEPNLVRFSRLVRDMAARTQFILITHSKTTIETAETLYGVTMQQPGVSQLVSVRIADHQNGVASGSRVA